MPVELRFDALLAGRVAASLAHGGTLKPSGREGLWSADDLVLLAAAALHEAGRRGPALLDPGWKGLDAAGRAAAVRACAEELADAVRWAAGCLRGLEDGAYERASERRVSAAFSATPREGPQVVVTRGRRVTGCGV